MGKRVPGRALVDTSALLALAARHYQYHERAHQFVTAGFELLG
jgi:predicted nucleic acid-binding protein